MIPQKMSPSKKVLIGFAALFLLIQLIPFGSGRSNPPVLKEPVWDSEETQNMARLACYDCHSNETIWPWYSYVAPVSWLVIYDVDEGRAELNFSEWGSGRHGEEGDEMAKEIRKGKMPLRPYILLHPEADLSAKDKEKLAKGLIATATPLSSREGAFEDSTIRGNGSDN